MKVDGKDNINAKLAKNCKLSIMIVNDIIELLRERK